MLYFYVEFGINFPNKGKKKTVADAVNVHAYV